MKETGENWWQEPLRLFYRLSAWILMPLIIGTFVGKWLDKKINAEPWGFLAVMLFCFVVSIIAMIMIASKELAKHSDSDKK